MAAWYDRFEQQKQQMRQLTEDAEKREEQLHVRLSERDKDAEAQSHALAQERQALIEARESALAEAERERTQRKALEEQQALDCMRFEFFRSLLLTCSEIPS